MSELKMVINAKYGKMHCIKCGKTDFVKNNDYKDNSVQWFKCTNCGLEFRKNASDIYDDTIYLGYGLLFALEDN